MRDEFTERLSDYVDGEDLGPAERLAIEAHLAGCASCRTVVAELREVASRAATLADTAPRTDLWPGIEERLATTPRVAAMSTRPVRRWSFTLPELVAAGLALMVLSGGMVWMARVGGDRADVPQVAAEADSDAVEVTPANFADAQYDRAIADLERTLTEGRGRLDPETVRILEENLAAIDRAIEQSRRALRSDPANTYLNAHLAEAKRRKLSLLRLASAAANAEG